MKMAVYKSSPEYDAYKKYLEEFKTKHTASRESSSNSCLLEFSTGAEDMRSRSVNQSSTSTRSSTHKYGAPMSDSTINSEELNSFAMGSNRAGQSYPAESTCPATQPLRGSNSFYITDPSSPISASPWSAALHQKGETHFPSSNASEFSPASLPPIKPVGPASTLDRLVQPFSPTQQPMDVRPLPSFVALLRAAELARSTHSFE